MSKRCFITDSFYCDRKDIPFYHTTHTHSELHRYRVAVSNISMYHRMLNGFRQFVHLSCNFLAFSSSFYSPYTSFSPFLSVLSSFFLCSSFHFCFPLFCFASIRISTKWNLPKVTFRNVAYDYVQYTYIFLYSMVVHTIFFASLQLYRTESSQHAKKN